MQLKQQVKRALRAHPAARVLSRLLQLALRANPDLEGSLGLSYHAGLLNLAVSPETARRIHRIPSVTYASERAFLYRFFRSLWPATGDVLEIGPLLGGTTCAIGLGMARNPRNVAERRLHTHDFIFGDEIDDHLGAYLEKVLASDRFAEATKTEIRRATRFVEAFEAIHHDSEYFDFLEIHPSRLPQSRADSGGAAAFSLAEDLRLDAVFVDGCKSWYATKHFMRVVVDRCPPGSSFIFQDYGYFQTFWVAAFVAAFGEHFNPVAAVHNTYAFEFSGKLTGAKIEESFPDEIGPADAPYVEEIFSGLSSMAARRRDPYAATAHRLHLAAALAYVGEKDDARRQIRRLARDPYLSPYDRALLAAISHEPTYRPDRTPVEL